MDPLTIFIIIAFIAALVSLVLGLGSMSRGGKYDEEHSGQYMRARVVSQGIAAFFILVALIARWTGL
jgi:hypothetical protein